MRITIQQWALTVFYFVIISTGYGILYNDSIGWLKYLGLVGPLTVGAILGKLFQYENKFTKRY